MDIRPKEMILTALFAALTAVGAYIKIPIPYVPLTLQVMFVFFAGSLLGSKLGLLSQVVYILTGLIGIPIFTHGGGPSYVFQPTFGYLVGFALGAYSIGKLIEETEAKTFISYLGINLVGLAVIYLLGVGYLYFNLNFIAGKATSLAQAIKIGFLAPLPGDLITCLIAAFVAQKVLDQVQTALPVSIG